MVISISREYVIGFSNSQAVHEENEQNASDKHLKHCITHVFVHAKSSLVIMYHQDPIKSLSSQRSSLISDFHVKKKDISKEVK